MQSLIRNYFCAPHEIRELALRSQLVNSIYDQYSGKGILYLFLTRFCGVGCPFCFFRSKPRYRSDKIEDAFNHEGVTKLIDFANAANLGYTMISGGGEPMDERQSVLRIVEHVRSDRIVMATSGNWAANRRAAESYLDTLYQAFKRRKTPAEIVIRQSISEGHSIKLGSKPSINLIEIFREKYAHERGFKFQIHTFEGDKQLANVLANWDDAVLEYEGENISDNNVVRKVIPFKYNLRFKDGYECVVGISRVFTSNLMVDLTKPENLEAAQRVFELDLIHSEGDNSATVDNFIGRPGIDWALNYNGNIYTWQNQVNDNLLNLYEDDFSTIIEETFRDPLVSSYIQKGRTYREKIVSEVNPLAVERVKGIAIRDYSGSIIFEEWKDRLYYMVRALQDMIVEQSVTDERAAAWPEEIRRLVALPQEELARLYHESSFCIFDQYILEARTEQEWLDVFMLTNRGHFLFSASQVERALKHFNKQFKQDLTTIVGVDTIDATINRRLTERYMYIKPSLSAQEESVLEDEVEAYV